MLFYDACKLFCKFHSNFSFSVHTYIYIDDWIKIDILIVANAFTYFSFKHKINAY
jgi:hypothetical protein